MSFTKGLFANLSKLVGGNGCRPSFSEFPIPLLPNPGGTDFDTPRISGNEGCASFEAAGRKLEKRSFRKRQDLVIS